MKINVNGKEIETGAATLAELARELELPAGGVAVAVDRKMASRADWASTPLTEGADVLIIKAVYGG